MTLQNEETERLFSYGTLQTEPVQIAIFGRTLEGTTGTLLRYRVIMSATEDQEFAKKNGAVHRNLQFTGVESDIVAGTVLTITPKDLEQADSYEPTDYQRVLVQLKSGNKAWVYLNSRQ